MVAKGLKQEYDIDFKEIFLPVVKMTTFHVMLCLVATENLELVQMDVKIAFLHSDLDGEIYMAHPEGFENPSKDIWCAEYPKVSMA